MGDFTPENFLIQVLLMKDFLSCKPKVKTSPPTRAPISKPRILFLLIIAVGVICLLAVSIYAFCRRSSLSKAMAKNTRNIRYNYQSISGSRKIESFGWSRGGGGGTSSSATTTDAPKKIKKGVKEEARTVGSPVKVLVGKRRGHSPQTE